MQNVTLPAFLTLLTLLRRRDGHALDLLLLTLLTLPPYTDSVLALLTEHLLYSTLYIHAECDSTCISDSTLTLLT